MRVAAPARANYELFLSRNLKHARLVSTQGAEAAVDLLVTGQVEALAGLTQALLDRLEQLPGSRLVEGRFMGVQQSIAVPKGREAGLAYLRRVVEDAKASGLVARAIERTGARGVSVAPRREVVPPRTPCPKPATDAGSTSAHASRGVPESPYAWTRLAAALVLSAIGGVGMWSVIVALPAVQAEFGVARSAASCPTP